MENKEHKLKCVMCFSTKNVDYYNVGNVGINQTLPLCELCKPRKENKE